jgi:4-amino-4-deoxy-L-arabinose transferase-like glycosyltransferase
MALATARVGPHAEALAQELIKPLYMTGIEASTRLLVAVLALGTLCGVMRFWTRIAGQRAGHAAGVFAAASPAWVYYAHTGNLEIPYLFCVTWALVELDRVMCDEARESQALALTTAAVLTKDQAAAALIVPAALALAVVPWASRRKSPFRRRLVVSTIAAIAVYAVVSGAAVNPVGYRRRIAFLLGPASQSWAGYPWGLHGQLALGRDALLAVPHFTSWPIALAAAAGVLVVATCWREARRSRALLPLAAAISFVCIFTLGARRTEDRFLLPLALLLVPYAAIAFERFVQIAGARARTCLGTKSVAPTGHGQTVVALAAAAALAPAVIGVASMDATLLADPRYEVERYLARLPAGTRVEVYGGPIFLPRIPPQLEVVRPGVEPIPDRQSIAGIRELVDPLMDPSARAPDVIVLATELSSVGTTLPPNRSPPFALISYRDARSHALFRSLLDGSIGYKRVLTARCRLPAPLECRRIHDSTGGEEWVYARATGGDTIPPGG